MPRIAFPCAACSCWDTLSFWGSNIHVKFVNIIQKFLWIELIRDLFVPHISQILEWSEDRVQHFRSCDLSFDLEDFVTILHLIKQIVALTLIPQMQRTKSAVKLLWGGGRVAPTSVGVTAADSTNVSNSLCRCSGDAPSKSPSRDAAWRRLPERARVRAVLNHAELRDCHPAHPLGMRPIHQPQTAVQQHGCRQRWHRTKRHG